MALFACRIRLSHFDFTEIFLKCDKAQNATKKWKMRQKKHKGNKALIKNNSPSALNVNTAEVDTKNIYFFGLFNTLNLFTKFKKRI